MIQKNFYNMTSYDNLLIIESFGLWDRDVAQKCFDDIWKTVMQCFPDKSYSIIYNITEWELSTPNAVRFWQEKFVLDIHFPTYLVYVVGKSKLKQWSVKRMFNDSTPCEVSFFDELREAVDWLESKGYHMSNSAPDHRLSLL